MSYIDPRKLETHFYDGKLEHQITTRFLPIEKKEYFKKLLDNLIIKSNPYAIQGLQLIIDNTGTQGNYDPTSKIYADDILMEICIILYLITNQIIIETLMINLTEQLSDIITSGPCVQGRTQRMYNIYHLFNDLPLVDLQFSFVDLTSEINILIITN